VYNTDIRNLLSMADMWRSRAPPIPLDFAAIRTGSSVLRPEKNETSHSNVSPPKTPSRSGVNGLKVASGKGSEKARRGNKTTQPVASSSASGGLKDQRTLTLHDNLLLFVSRYVTMELLHRSTNPFVSSTNRLGERLRAGESTISFDKDDDDTLDFVTAASNLRSAAYGIEGKTRWEIKGVHHFRSCL
jgi:ubiquitin-like 1-activating enzyme E1 B